MEKEKYKIEYWIDEESRDEGYGEILIDEYSSFKDAQEVARELIDGEGYASVEVLLKSELTKKEEQDVVFWGYDGEQKWGLIEERYNDAVFAFLTFTILQKKGVTGEEKKANIDILKMEFRNEKMREDFLKKIDPKIKEMIEKDLVKGYEEEYLKEDEFENERE